MADQELEALFPEINESTHNKDCVAQVYHDEAMNLPSFTKSKFTPEDAEYLTKSMLGDEAMPPTKITVDDEEVSQLIKDLSGEEPKPAPEHKKLSKDEFRMAKRQHKEAVIQGDWEAAEELEKSMYGKLL
jgi:hypothetical protein